MRRRRFFGCLVLAASLTLGAADAGAWCATGLPCSLGSCYQGGLGVCIVNYCYPLQPGTGVQLRNCCTDPCTTGPCGGGGFSGCIQNNGCLGTGGSSCDDGNACTVGTQCGSGEGPGGCGGGQVLGPTQCSDNNDCTTDSCNTSIGCVNTPNTISCNDGNACTTTDHCSGGSCVPGPPPNCNDQNECTDDECFSSSGCQNSPNTNACNDGNQCTTSDSCSGASCQGVNVPSGASCDDGNLCTDPDICSVDAACMSGQVTSCDDLNECTDDTCDAALGCLSVDNSAACDDGNPCTEGDTCTGGVCQPGQPLECPQDKGQGKCLIALTKAGVKAAGAQARGNSGCLKGLVNGKVSDLEMCLLSDLKGKVSKAATKAHDTDQKFCSSDNRPDYGYVGANALLESAIEQQRILITALFGSEPAIALGAGAADKTTSKCQMQLVKASQGLMKTAFKEFLLCQKEGLKDGTIDRIGSLEDCFGRLVASGYADPFGKPGKLRKAGAKLIKAVDKRCASVDVAPAIPSCASGGASSPRLAECVSRHSMCRACLALVGMNGLSQDCDAFDDDVLSGIFTHLVLDASCQ